MKNLKPATNLETIFLILVCLALIWAMLPFAHAAIVCPPGMQIVVKENAWGNAYEVCEGQRTDLDEHGCIIGSEFVGFDSSGRARCHAPDIAEAEPSCEEHLWHERRALKAAQRTIKRLRRRR